MPRPAATITLQPSVTLRPVTMSPRALTISPLPYSTGFASTANGMLRAGNGANALAIASATGSTMPTIA